jgi:glycosyltransferase involved in cell wall biosynthesis
VRVIVAGDGPELPHLVEQASRRGVELESLGSISADELAVKMASCHLQVQPSLTTTYVVEQFGRSVAEAMTVGLPCVVSDSGELPRVVGLDRGAIFPEGDVERLAELLGEFADSPRHLADLSRRQKSISRKYDAPDAAAAVLDFWAAATA